MMLRYKVINTTDDAIERGGYIFPPLSASLVDFTSDYQRRHVKAKVGLQVIPIEQEVEQNKEQRFACSYCDFIAKSKAGLTAHVNSKHPEGEGGSVNEQDQDL